MSANIWWYIRSSCIFSTFSINKSAPWGNFTSIYLKKHQKILKTKKVIAKSSSENFWDEIFWIISRSKKIDFSLKIVWKWKNLISKIFDFFDLKFFHFHTIFNENFWNFLDRKFSKFFVLKFFDFHTNFNENFQNFSISIFFSKFFKKLL